jgi:heme-degrading monooxygenase HmoA
MHAAIRRYELGAGSTGDFMRVVAEGLADTLAELPGFLGYHVIASASDEIVSVTLFGDEEAAVRSNRIAAEFARDRLQRFQPNLTSELSGEVGVSRRQPEARGG